MSPPLLINGEPVPDGPRWRPPPAPPPAPRPRVFDHLDGAPADEEQHFVRVARAMRSAPSWRAVPTYTAPAPVAGELRGKTERGKRALCALNRMAPEDIAAAIELLDERTRAKFVRALRGAL